MTIPILSGLEPIAGRYEGLILDLWGVAHDGRAPYEGALECLGRLRAEAKRVLFLSNAPRRAEKIAPFLEAMGIEQGRHYDHLISSGDVAREALAGRHDAWHRALGAAYFHIGPERDEGLLQGLDYHQAASLEEADFVLATGLFNDERESIEDYAPLIAEAVARSLPMVCVNPDLTVVRGDKQVPCAGSLAQAYAATGGEVRYHGKPYPRAYELCFQKLDGISRRRILIVGDSLATDIAGAEALGLDAILITSGIHAGEFGAKPGEAPDRERLEAACARVGAWPMAAMATLLW